MMNDMPDEIWAFEPSAASPYEWVESDPDTRAIALREKWSGASYVLRTNAIDPEMKADQLRLHFGELTADEIRLVRAVLRFASSRHAQNPHTHEGGGDADN